MIDITTEQTKELKLAVQAKLEVLCEQFKYLSGAASASEVPAKAKAEFAQLKEQVGKRIEILQSIKL